MLHLQAEMDRHTSIMLRDARPLPVPPLDLNDVEVRKPLRLSRPADLGQIKWYNSFPCFGSIAASRLARTLP